MLLVFKNSLNEIIGHSNIKNSVRFITQDINITF